MNKAIDLKTRKFYKKPDASKVKSIKLLANLCHALKVEIEEVSKSKNSLYEIKSENHYINELNTFYNKTVQDQLAVETIVIDWVPDDFETREWASIEVGFYGVKLNGKFWDGMKVHFGTDINSKQKQKWKKLNRIEVYHGFSHPDFFSSWEGSWVSNWNGHYGWNSSFPKGPRMKHFNAKSRDEKLLMIRLLQAMEHLLENEDSSPQLMKNSYAKKWLQERINEANSLNWNLKDNSIPNTKIFSYPRSYAIGKSRKFQCGPKRAGIDLKKITLMNEKISLSLPSEFLDKDDINLGTLLLPDIDLGLEDKEFLSIISYEGYQLK